MADYELVGEFDEPEARAFARAILAMYEAEPVRRVVVDAAGVDYAGSSMLAALVRCHKAAEAGGGSFEVSRPSPIFLRLLQLAGLDESLVTDSH